MRQRFRESVQDDWLTIVMDSPNPSLDEDNLCALARLIRNHPQKTVVIASEGSTFCAGLDLKEVLAEKSAEKSLVALVELFNVLIDHPGPTCCLVNAPAIGGGVGLALCADVIIMSCNASFQLPVWAPYRSLADVLFPFAAARRNVRLHHFNSWYGNATSASVLLKQGHVDRVIHSNRFDDMLAEVDGVLDNSKYIPAKRKKPSKKETESRLKEAIASSRQPCFIAQTKKLFGELEPGGVFVVHGRNMQAANAVFQLVESMGIETRSLRSIEEEFKTSNSLWQTIYIGIQLAEAVIVLLTPDDEAQLTGELGQSEPRMQARPNVFLELGLALGICPEKTILLNVPPSCMPTDLLGHLRIEVGDNEDWREVVETRLGNLDRRPVQANTTRVARPERDAIYGSIQ